MHVLSDQTVFGCLPLAFCTKRYFDDAHVATNSFKLLTNLSILLIGKMEERLTFIETCFGFVARLHTWRIWREVTVASDTPTTLFGLQQLVTLEP